MVTITGLSGNEIFCLQRRGLTPGDLVIGNSIISLGLLGSISSELKTLFGGKVKTYVYNLGGGIIEFLAIGTAVRKMAGVSTNSETLLPQAIIRDQDTFIIVSINTSLINSMCHNG